MSLSRLARAFAALIHEVGMDEGLDEKFRPSPAGYIDSMGIYDAK